MPYTRPAYPAVLTKANWDKKKGTIAKMAGATGVGAALDALKKAYDAVAWDKFEISKNRPSQSEFSLAKMEQMKKAALAEMGGAGAKLRAAAFAARDAAKAAAPDLKKNPLTKATGALCDEIAKAADFMGVGANANSLSGYIEKDIAEARQAYDFTVEQIRKGIPGKVAALANALKAMGEPSAESWKAQALMTRCRDLNQLIGNVPKLVAAGYDLGVDAGKAKTFFEDMRPFASKDVPFKEGDEAAAKKAKADVTALCKRGAAFG